MFRRDSGEVDWKIVLVAACVAVVAFAAVFAAIREPWSLETEYAAKKAAELPPQTQVVVAVGDDPPKVLLVGDSLAAGLFATTADDDFASLLAAGLGGAEVETVAQPGAATGAISDLVVGESGIDLAVVEVGTNDVPLTAAPLFRTQYRGLLEKIQSAAPDVPLICLGAWVNDDRGLDDVIQEECATFDGAFVPLQDLWDEPQNRGPEGRETWQGEADYFHPNDQGHALIAERLLAAIDVN